MKDINAVLDRYDKLMRLLLDPATSGPELDNIKIRIKTVLDQYPGMDMTWRKWIAQQNTPEAKVIASTFAEKIYARVADRVSPRAAHFVDRFEQSMNVALDATVDDFLDRIIPDPNKPKKKERPVSHAKKPVNAEPEELDPDYGTKDWSDDDLQDSLDEYLDVADIKIKSSKDDEIGDLLVVKFTAPAGLLDFISDDPDACRDFVLALLGLDEEGDDEDEDEEPDED